MIPHSAARRWRCDTCMYVTALSVLSELQKPGTAHRNPDAIFRGGGGAGRGGWCDFTASGKCDALRRRYAQADYCLCSLPFKAPVAAFTPGNLPLLPAPLSSVEEGGNVEEGGMMSLTTITCSRPAPPSFRPQVNHAIDRMMIPLRPLWFRALVCFCYVASPTSPHRGTLLSVPFALPTNLRILAEPDRGCFLSPGTFCSSGECLPFG